MKADARWQAVWEQQRCFAAAKATSDARQYACALEMFPYPSGAIHMGHIRRYTIGDVMARYKAMTGHARLPPAGRDSICLTSDNGAIAQEAHTASSTRPNIATIRAQLTRLGLAIDGNRAVSTCAPDYDRHEQLIVGMVTHETYWVSSGGDDIIPGYWVSPDEVETRGDGQRFEIATGRLVTTGPNEKMSPSKKNVVDPVAIFDQFGADAVRWFMLSDSPAERDLPWNEAGIEASWRFVQRLWRLFSSLNPSSSGVSQPPLPVATERSVGLGRGDNAAVDSALHRAIAGISADIERLGLNTAVARVHALANEIEKAPASDSRATAIRTLVRLIAPMMPHLAEEAWELTGGHGLVVHQPWPEHDPALLVETQMMIAVQVAGKRRDTLALAKDATNEELEAAALANEKIIGMLEGATPKKVIVVPGRLVNIVI